MSTHCLLDDGWAGSAGCALGDLEDERVLCRNKGFGPGTSDPDRAVLLGWSSSGMLQQIRQGSH